MQAKTFYAEESIWEKFKRKCKRFNVSMNSRISHLVERDIDEGDAAWKYYKGVDPKLRKQFEQLCKLAGVSPSERIEQLIVGDCHRLIVDKHSIWKDNAKETNHD